MSHVILLCISLIFLMATFFLYRLNIELFLCMLIVLNYQFFYIVPQVKGPEDYSMLLLPIVAVLLIESYLRGKTATGRYGWCMAAFLGISLFGIIVACFSGQSLLLGIKASKYASFALIYFLLARRRIDTLKFARYFIFMALAIAAVATLQYLMRSRLDLFPGLAEKQAAKAFAESRFTMGGIVIVTGTAIAFTRYVQSFSFKYLAAAIILFLELVFVCQTRALIASVMATMLIVYFISRRITLIRTSAYSFIVVLLVLACLVISSADLYKIPLVNRTSNDIIYQRGSYSKRLQCYAYYWYMILKKPVTGYGLHNINWEGGNQKELQIEGLFATDIGVVAFIYQAGIIGVAWLAFLLYTLWRDIFKFRENMVISTYFMIATFTMPTIDLIDRFDNLFLFSIFLGLFANYIYGVTNKNKSLGSIANGCFYSNRQLQHPRFS